MKQSVYRLLVALAVALFLAACNQVSTPAPGVQPGEGNAIGGLDFTVQSMHEVASIPQGAGGLTMDWGQVATVRDFEADPDLRYLMVTLRLRNTTGRTLHNVVYMAHDRPNTLGNTPFTTILGPDYQPLSAAEQLAIAEALEATVAVDAEGDLDYKVNSYIQFATPDLDDFIPEPGVTQILNDGFAVFAADGSRSIAPGEYGYVTVSYVAPVLPGTENFHVFGFAGAFYEDPAERMPAGRVPAVLSVLSVTDINGNAFDIQNENQPVEALNKWIMAAQTEEPVCVAVSVTDNTGAPVRGAEVRVTATEVMGSTVSLQRGCVATQSESIDRIYTDANGQARFTVFATFASTTDIYAEPVKLVIGATDAVSGNLDIEELKIFFFNITHLFHTGSDVDGEVFTGRRIGTPGVPLAQFENVYQTPTTVIPEPDNTHFFNAHVYQRQPSVGPWYAGDDLNFDGNQWFERMTYVMSGEDTDLVSFVSGCEVITPDGLTCWDEDGSGVAIAPVAGVDLADFPLDVTITATMRVAVDYIGYGLNGDDTYYFDLKEYSFDKRWVVGFLEIDKYVDQHVLTWAGPEVTLAASNAPVASAAPYTSTVHITVNNPSDQPIYNVTVRDALPAELGVVTASISDGGTYDPINHVVTWDFVGTPVLAQLDPGEVLTFTFDVYSRQKPGYCWAGGAVDDYVVQPLYPEPVEGDCEPYPDPFVVTNGAFDGSVNAAGFLQEDVFTQQVVWAYIPQADESDIWTVRPLFEIEKVLQSSSPMATGAAAFYQLRIRQIDRVSATDDPGNTEYAFLNVLYPWEFYGTDGTGTGHRAPSSDVRNNPYARNLTVYDAWDLGLDFTNATPIRINGLAVANPIVAGAVVNKSLSWQPIPQLLVGQLALANLTLTANIPSDDPRNLRDDDFWYNCLYLGAPQLNQPVPNFGYQVFADTYYAQEDWVPYWQYQIEPEFNPAFELVGPAAELDRTGWLEDCAPVTVLPPPPTAPFVAFTNNGEFIGFSYSNAPNVDGDQRDGFLPGVNFAYKLTAHNTGTAIATNVDISGTLINDTNPPTVLLNGNGYLWRLPAGADPNIAANWVLIQTITLTDQLTYDFAPVSLSPGQQLRVGVQARTVQPGNVQLLSELNYDSDPAYQATPLTVLEDTSVRGPVQ